MGLGRTLCGEGCEGREKMGTAEVVAFLSGWNNKITDFLVFTQCLDMMVYIERAFSKITNSCLDLAIRAMSSAKNRYRVSARKSFEEGRPRESSN